MQPRILSFALLWLVLVLALFFFGVHAGVALVAAIAAFTQLELYRMFEKMGLRPVRSLGLACGVAIVVGGYYIGGEDPGNDLFLLSFLILTFTVIHRDLQAGRLRSFMPTLFGLLYVPYLLHFLVKIVRLAEDAGESTTTGVFLAVWIVAVAKASDVGGLLLGMRFGKHPLSTISPKKTYEGALGGILTSVLLGVLLLVAFPRQTPDALHLWLGGLFCVPVAIAAIASDLVESAFKRQADVKDSGKIFPGIGGVFDLADSLILSSPLAYLLFKYLLFQ